MSPRIAQLKDAIEEGSHCTARHIDSTPVIELFYGTGEVGWDGVVETFELAGHPEAKYCYAWLSMEKDKPRCVVVLEGPHGVNSPEKAVKLAIKAEAYHKRTKWWPGMS